MTETSTRSVSAGMEVEKSGPSREHDITRVCWIAFWLSTGLAVFEIANGLLGYSPLLIIDGLTSAAIAVILTTTLLGIHMSDESAVSGRYYYSRGKVQFLAALMAGIVLGVAGITYWGISIKRIRYPTEPDAIGIGTAIAIIAMLASILILLFLRHIRLNLKAPNFRGLERLQELGLVASMMVFQSYFSVAYRWYVGDRIARFSISLIVTTMSFFIIKDALNGLMDRSSGEEIERDIRILVGKIDRISDVKWIRTRRVGSKIYTEMKVEIDKDRKVSEFDEVTTEIKKVLSSQLEEPIRLVNVEYCVAE